MRTVDGFIHRLLDGLEVEAVEKTGDAMTLHATNGERWQLWFVNPNTGDLIKGEPAIQHGPGLPVDGHINTRLAGQTIDNVKTDGQQVLFNLVGGGSIVLAWVDELGQRIKAEPCLRKVDVVIGVPGVSIFGEAGM